MTAERLSAIVAPISSEADMAKKAMRERRASGYKYERTKAARQPAKAKARSRVPAPRNATAPNREIDPFGAFTEWLSKEDERAFGNL
jgi:hypothetical protein